MKTNCVAIRSFAWCLLLVAAAACKKVDIEFGDSTIADPNIAYIDTISYQLSTIQSDSFITSASGALMVGRHTDAELGTLQAETYFHLATPGTTAIPDGAIYDSTRLIVVPNGDYYGDTLAPFTLSAYQVMEEISLGEQVRFYNTRQFATAASSLGTATVRIRPAAPDTIRLPVSHTLGQNLLRMVRVSSDTLSDDAHFFQYLKGISIKATAADNSVYSFKCTDSTVQLRVYYHYTNPDPQTGYITCKYLADNLQFNHVATSRTGTALQVLTPQARQRISSTLTGHRSYIQHAGGLQLRIDLPYLRHFKTEAVYRKILKAELYVRPYGYTNSSLYRLPSNLTLYTASDDNLPSAYVPDKNTGNAQTVAPTIDYLYGRDTYYLFNISSYVTGVIDGATENYEGLFLQTPTYTTNHTVDRLILADPALYKSVEIRIYRLLL